MATPFEKNQEAWVKNKVRETLREEAVEKENKERSRLESETAYWQARAEMPSF